MWRTQCRRQVARVANTSILGAQRYLANYTRTLLPLNNDTKIPALGFGTWQDKDAQEDAVYHALNAGYRHIDTARVYGTEPAVAKGIARANVPRSELYLTTKLWNNSHHPDDVLPALDASLKDLKTDYVDLYLMHWPGAFKSGPVLRPTKDGKVLTDNIDYLDTWKAMESLLSTGKTKSIGISNFSKTEVERLLSKSKTPPAVHQYECHPYLAQHSFADFHKSNNIHVTQYSPFGNSNTVYSKGKDIAKLIDDPMLADIGKKYGKNGAQVALAWGIAKGRSVIPKSKTPSRIKLNLEGDFVLEDVDVGKIDSLDRKLRFNDPSDSFGYNFYVGLDGKE
ncbi:putative oxido [Cyphellophora attinorum]|uniref:D-xylose reductase [NAD(P)H] n=1 Tax=Cyphellophora attinorum TaxID=1664694 RepID=A0A0N0NQX1_9EURO|nr:putative oxido [Phialophora attinorum]KPI44421.1 putative oxido [Phialophora attinorum]